MDTKPKHNTEKFYVGCIFVLVLFISVSCFSQPKTRDNDTLSKFETDINKNYTRYVGFPFSKLLKDIPIPVQTGIADSLIRKKRGDSLDYYFHDILSLYFMDSTTLFKTYFERANDRMLKLGFFSVSKDSILSEHKLHFKYIYEVIVTFNQPVKYRSRKYGDIDNIRPFFPRYFRWDHTAENFYKDKIINSVKVIKR